MKVHIDPWNTIDSLHNINLTVSWPVMTIASAQHPDGWPGPLELVTIDLGWQGGPHLHISPVLDVGGLGSAPHLVGLQPGRGDAAILVLLSLDGDLIGPRILTRLIVYNCWPRHSCQLTWVAAHGT